MLVDSVCILRSSLISKSNSLAQSALYILPQSDSTCERLSHSSSAMRSFYNVRQCKVQRLTLLFHPGMFPRMTGSSPSKYATTPFNFRSAIRSSVLTSSRASSRAAGGASPLAAAPGAAGCRRGLKCSRDPNRSRADEGTRRVRQPW